MPMNHIMNWRIFFVMVNVFIFCHSRILTSKEEMPLSGLLSDFKNEGDNIIEKRQEIVSSLRLALLLAT